MEWDTQSVNGLDSLEKSLFMAQVNFESRVKFKSRIRFESGSKFFSVFSLSFFFFDSCQEYLSLENV